MSRPIPVLAVASCIALAPTPGAAAEPSLEAWPREGPVVVDGRLDEPAWAGVPVATGFRQWSPERGEPALLETEVRVVYDVGSLYVAARLENPAGPRAVAARVHRRDQDSYADWFGVAIDVEARGRVARMFRVNAANVQRDLLQIEGAADDDTWDAVWESATAADGGGWNVEMRIPLEVLRPRASAEPQEWGIYFYRENQVPYEVTGWMVVPRGEQGFVSHFYRLRGLRIAAPPQRRELVTYGSGRYKTAAIAPYDDAGGALGGGLDARLGLGPAAQLDLSLLPDFGQVEVDRQVLNLSATETLFTEKRPFFTEGADAFALPGFTLFYSRRIGRALSPPELPAADRVREQPLSAEVLAAGRLSLQTPEGWRLALLGAGTRAAEAVVRRADGGAARVALAPAQEFGALRWSRQLGERGAYLGGFAGWTAERGESGRRATVGALDGAWRSAAGRTEANGIVAGACAGRAGGEASGWGLHAALEHTFTRPWSVTLDLTEISRRFDANDLGYLDRADLRQGWIDVRRIWDRTAGVFRNWEVAFGGMLREDQAGHALRREWEVTLGSQFTSFWHATLLAGAELAAEDDLELRTFERESKSYLARPDRPFVLLRLGTPPHAAWSASAEVERSSWEGGPTLSAQVTQVLRPSSRLELELETGYRRARGERRWLATTRADEPIVGLRSLSQLDLLLRVSYAVTPRAGVQLFSQWLAADWAYRDLELWRPGGRGQRVAFDGPTAFSDRAWTLNLIGRWEYRPGSVAYLVYSRGAVAPRATAPAGDGRLDLDRALADLPDLPAQEVVQVKITWSFDVARHRAS